MNNEITIKKWLLGLLICIILGIFLFFSSVKIIFNPNFTDLFNVGILILQNLTSGTLKFKAYLCVLFGLMPPCSLIVYFFIHNVKNLENYGSASFAEEKDFAKMNINGESGLMLGCLYKERSSLDRIQNKKDEIRYFIRCLSPLACLIVAPPGTGKTASIALPNLFSLTNSVVVLDIKGELYQKSAGYRQQNFKHKILRFSPLNTSENTMFFNPFDRKVVENLDYVEMKQLADQIAGTIFVGEKGKENDHWIVSAKTMFSFYATYFMQKNKHTSLGELAQAPKKDFFDDISDELKKQFQLVKESSSSEYDGVPERDFTKDTSKAFYTQVANDETLHDITRNQAKAYTTAAETEFASVKSTYDTFMAVFQNPRVISATSTMSFDYYDLREEKISCYIVIQSEDIDILAPLIRIFVETMFKKLMSGKENSDPNKFIYFLGDEFVRFGKMPYLLEAPALCRSYGLIPIYITQSYEQIKKYYGEDDLNILRSNVGYQVVFTMNSSKDAEELSKMIGKFTRKKISRSKGNFDLLKANDSTSSEGYELVPAQDILNMPNTDILILIRGFVKHPIKAKVNYWFKNPAWSGADKIPVLNESELKAKELQVLQEAEEAKDSKAEESQAQENAQESQKAQIAQPRKYIQMVKDDLELTNVKKEKIREAQEVEFETSNSLDSYFMQSKAENTESQKDEKSETTAQTSAESQEAQKAEAKQDSSDSSNTETKEAQETTESQNALNVREFIKTELGGNKGIELFFKHLINTSFADNDFNEEARQRKIEQIRNLVNNNLMQKESIDKVIKEIKDKLANKID